MANPVVVVTGVGPGTGAAIARRFSRGGYAVAMLARSRDRLTALEREIERARAYPCDVIDEAELQKTLDAICADHGTPKVLVHNAVGGAFGNFLEIDPAVLNRNFQVNTMALLHLARRLAPGDGGGGRGRHHHHREHLGDPREGQLRGLCADQGGTVNVELRPFRETW